MEASVLTASTALEEHGVESVTPKEEDELKRALENMTVEDLLQNTQAVQTDSNVEEQGVNTDPDWESQVVAMLEYSSTLTGEYEGLKKKQDEEEQAKDKHKQQLQKKKEDTTRQHQALLEKLESVRVKLQLNNSKATRKNFLAKKQEMTSEKNKAEEERNRLAIELEESESKLRDLTEEQSDEQRRWQEELEELRKEMEQVKKEAKEAELQALKDEIAAVEKQRDVTMEQFKGWFSEVSKYLEAFQGEFPHQYHHEKQKWEKKQGVVAKNRMELQNRFTEVLQQLQEGRELESLPRIKVPALPQIPEADIRFNKVMQPLHHPQFMPPPPPPHHMIRPPPRPPHFYHPPPHYHPQYRQRYQHPPPPHHFQPPHPSQHYPPPSLQPHIRAPMRVTPPPSLSPSPPVALSPPPPTSTASSSTPADKLDKVLDKLGARFPQCNRTQLKSLLQQVKISRGTLAGMSVEDLMEQVGARLTQSGGAAPGPVSRAPPGPIQRPSASPQRAAGGGGDQKAVPRKLCLMCQNLVDPESRHPLSCTHTIHKDCIKVWLQSSKNNSCPFCPTK